MNHIIKYKLYRYMIATSFVSLSIISSVFLSSQRVLAGTTQLCFYYPTGTLYNCTDVSSGDTTLTPSGQCFTTDGSVSTANNKQQLNWTTGDCSASEFAGNAFADCSTTQITNNDTGSCCFTQNSVNSCALPVSSTSTAALTTCPGANSDCQSIISHYINPVIDFLAAGVGLIVTIMIVIGGIQYITSQDNPQAISAARSRIFNAVVALVVFALMYSLLQWLVPGGIFNS